LATVPPGQAKSPSHRFVRSPGVCTILR
jgi:hypothetical protein